MGSDPIEILLVEDNALDIKLTKSALKDSKIRHNLSVVRNGEEALEFLFQHGRYEFAARPDLVLLDTNLPRIDGCEVLREVRAAPELRDIPVVILTSSKADEDFLREYELDVNSYITKPFDELQFFGALKTIEHLGIDVVSLPESKRQELRRHFADGVNSPRTL